MLKEQTSHATECRSEDHDKHLCYLTSQGFHLSDADEFKTLINRPKFSCQRCGRHANSNANLCLPEELDIEY